MTRPPRLAEWWLARRIWPDERETILGDLSELYRVRVAASGRFRAAWWYWRESQRLGWGLRARESGARWERGSLMAFDDVRHAARRLRRQPIGSVVSVVTLALAIASATVAWSVVQTVLVAPLPVRDPATLVVTGVQRARGGSDRVSTSDTYMYPLYRALRDSGAFEGLAAGGVPSSVLEGTGPSAQYRRAYFASYDYFDTLDVRPQLGRAFTADDDRFGAPLVAVITHRYWTDVLGRDPAVLGREIELASQAVRIVGVAPPRFSGLDLTDPVDLFVPLAAAGPLIPRFSLYGEDIPDRMLLTWIEVVARVPAGVSADAAAERATAALRGHDESVAGVTLVDVNTAAIPEASREGVARFGRLLAATAGLLLLVGSLTVGMLLLIRTEARREEFGMCLALGASRGRLARGIALESVLLCCAAVLLSIPVMVWLLAAIAGYELPGRLTLGALELSVRGRVLLTTGAVALGTCAFLTLLATAFGMSGRPADALRSRAGVTPRLSRRWARTLLVTGQVAVSLVLVSACALFVRSVDEALGLNPHIDTARLMRGTIVLPDSYDEARRTQFFAELRARLEAHPLIAAVAYTSEPGGMGGGGQLVIDGEPRPVPAYTPFIGVDERYFATMGIQVVAGRGFEAGDDGDAPPVAVVSESFGRFIANGADPIGRRIAEYFRAPGGAPRTIEVVGVVPDVINRVTTLEPPALYLPVRQEARSSSRRVITLRATGNLDTARRDAQAAIQAQGPELRPITLESYDELMLRQMAPQLFGATIMGGLGLVAVLLTVLGTYVMAESMSTMRRREMGIRAALGATRRQLGGLVLGETTRLVGGGIVLGLILAWAGGGLVRGLLFQVEPLDPAALGVVVLLMAGLAAAVSLRPALRAGRVDLLSVLRED
jgi:predicted permease